LAHARRKFYDLWATNRSTIAEEALEFFRLLYDIERDAQALAPDERRRWRQEKAVPVAKALQDWLEAQRARVPEGLAIAKAIDYSRGRWPALTRYLNDGELPCGGVEMWRGGRRFRLSVGRPFRLAVPEYLRRSSVSTSPSSNRTCGSPASGSLPTHQAFAFERSRASGSRRISPNCS
jgi:hypothetical protein